MKLINLEFQLLTYFKQMKKMLALYWFIHWEKIISILQKNKNFSPRVKMIRLFWNYKIYFLFSFFRNFFIACEYIVGHCHVKSTIPFLLICRQFHMLL